MNAKSSLAFFDTAFDFITLALGMVNRNKHWSTDNQS